MIGCFNLLLQTLQIQKLRSFGDDNQSTRVVRTGVAPNLTTLHYFAAFPFVLSIFQTGSLKFLRRGLNWTPRSSRPIVVYAVSAKPHTTMDLKRKSRPRPDWRTPFE